MDGDGAQGHTLHKLLVACMGVGVGEVTFSSGTATPKLPVFP